jgi:hypothetical protein
MPQSKKRETARTSSQRRFESIISNAQAIDRRRQAQIANQIATINRLLARFDEASYADHLNRLDPHAQSSIPTSHAVYSEEMRMLHEGAAVLVAERDEAIDVLRQLVAVVEKHAESHDQFGELLAATRRARDVIGLSAPVSEHEGATG